MQPEADDVADELGRQVRKFWGKGRRQAREVSSLVIFERASVDYSLHVRDLCTGGWEIGAGTQENRRAGCLRTGPRRTSGAKDTT